MKKALLIIITLISFVATSQNKKSYYYTFQGQQISEKTYRNSQYINGEFAHHLMTFEDDTSYVHQLHPRKLVGKLTITQMDSLRGFFYRNYNKKIAKDEHITINYHISVDEKKYRRKTQWNVYNSNYIKRLNKIFKQQQFFICDRYESLINQKSKDKYLIDHKSFFKQLFFPYFIKYGSFAIIKPDGRFVVVYGEYGKDTVWETAKEISKTK